MAKIITREEEISQACANYKGKLTLLDYFFGGAEWADSHPRKGLVDIERVCKFIANEAWDYVDSETMDFNTDAFIKDLRKAMEE